MSSRDIAEFITLLLLIGMGAAVIILFEVFGR